MFLLEAQCSSVSEPQIERFHAMGWRMVVKSGAGAFALWNTDQGDAGM